MQGGLLRHHDGRVVCFDKEYNEDIVKTTASVLTCQKCGDIAWRTSCTQCLDGKLTLQAGYALSPKSLLPAVGSETFTEAGKTAKLRIYVAVACPHKARAQYRC